MIFNALALSNADPNYVPIIQGFVIIIAVAFDVLGHRGRDTNE